MDQAQHALPFEYFAMSKQKQTPTFRKIVPLRERFTLSTLMQTSNPIRRDRAKSYRLEGEDKKGWNP